MLEECVQVTMKLTPCPDFQPHPSNDSGLDTIPPPQYNEINDNKTKEAKKYYRMSCMGYPRKCIHVFLASGLFPEREVREAAEPEQASFWLAVIPQWVVLSLNDKAASLLARVLKVIG